MPNTTSSIEVHANLRLRLITLRSLANASVTPTATVEKFASRLRIPAVSGKVNECTHQFAAVEFVRLRVAIAGASDTDSARTQQPCRFQAAIRLGAAPHTIPHRPRNPDSIGPR
jgi:hypothetical protein